MKTENRMRKCPDKEFLSLCADNLLPEDSPEFKHIASCKDCGAELATYKKLSKAIELCLVNSVPEDFADKSLAKFREGLAIERSQAVSFPMLTLARAASILFFLSSVFFFVSSLLVKVENEGFEPSSASPSLAAKADAGSGIIDAEENVPSRQTVASASPLASPSKEESAFQGNSVSFEDMSFVSAGTRERFRRFPENKSDQAARIPRIVRHVWSVNDVEKAKSRLAQIIAQRKADSQVLHSREKSPSRVKFAVGKIQKKELVDIVKQLSGEGFTLLSPEEPQPERNFFEGSPEEPVRYYFDIVKS